MSYATAIVKLSLQQFPPVPTPNGYGWELKEGELEIVWMLRKPAPVQILELISCNCRRSKCKTQGCLCRAHALQCTDLCGCGNCENGGLVSSDADKSANDAVSTDDDDDDDSTEEDDNFVEEESDDSFEDVYSSED